MRLDPVKRAVNRALEPLGYRLIRTRSEQPPTLTKPAPTKTSVPKGAQPGTFDVDEFSQSVIARVAGRTMTSQFKVLGLIDALRYLHRHGIDGDVVECGVWRGGSMMAAALTLKDLGDTGRDLYLYDTFEGMSEATEHDVRRRDGQGAAGLLEGAGSDSLLLARATLDDVKAGMATVHYPGQVHYVVGKVEDTIPETAPERIALLRLDTDWFASTAHELEHLYPRLVPGGVLILDDYGYWDGARKAVDEFLERTGEQLLLVRISEGRIAVKPTRGDGTPAGR
jgi:hypothetical protein